MQTCRPDYAPRHVGSSRVLKASPVVFLLVMFLSFRNVVGWFAVSPRSLFSLILLEMSDVMNFPGLELYSYSQASGVVSHGKAGC